MNGTYTIPGTELRDMELVEGHASIELLDAYHRGILSENEVLRIRRHLVLCRECSETLLDLVQFLEKSPEPSRLWSAELTAAWEEWLAALRKREAAGPTVSQEDLEPVAR